MSAFRLGYLDRQGLQTNLLANALILLTAGLSLLPALHRVWRLARSPARLPDACGGAWVVVLGHALESGRPSREFRTRLGTAFRVARACPGARMLVLGGCAPDQSVSEARVGQSHLCGLGMEAGRIHLEEHSRHTLENFHRALPLLADQAQVPVILVTSRYHLARSVTMAHNLGLNVFPYPAQIGWRPEKRVLMGILWEAYLLHWYHVGRLFARATGNAEMLARVDRRA